MTGIALAWAGMVLSVWKLCLITLFLWCVGEQDHRDVQRHPRARVEGQRRVCDGAEPGELWLWFGGGFCAWSTDEGVADSCSLTSFFSCASSRLFLVHLPHTSALSKIPVRSEPLYPPLPNLTPLLCSMHPSQSSSTPLPPLTLCPLLVYDSAICSTPPRRPFYPLLSSTPPR